MAMHGEVIKITSKRSCQVRTENDILVVFPEPASRTLPIGGRLRFHNLSIGTPVRVDNLTRGVSFEIQVPSHDIHDLRLPVNHGGSRTPNAERLNAP
jgi:hypothetical protein